MELPEGAAIERHLGAASAEYWLVLRQYLNRGIGRIAMEKKVRKLFGGKNGF